MKNLNYKIVLFFIAILSLNSCILDDTVTEFGKGPIVVQFQKKSGAENFLQDDTGKIYDYKIPIQYFGGDNNPLEKEVKVTVAVSSTSEAKEGVEFTIPNKEVIIPAGANQGYLLVKVNSAVLDANNPHKMILKIISSSESVSDNQNLTSIRLQAVCPSNLEGSYSVVRPNGSVKQVTITSTGTGTYEVSGDARFAANYPFNISDVCGKITITGAYLTDNFGIPVSGNGTVDKITGKITIFFTAEGYASNLQMVYTKN